MIDLVWLLVPIPFNLCFQLHLSTTELCPQGCINWVIELYMCISPDHFKCCFISFSGLLYINNRLTYRKYFSLNCPTALKVNLDFLKIRIKNSHIQSILKWLEVENYQLLETLQKYVTIKILKIQQGTYWDVISPGWGF